MVDISRTIVAGGWTLIPRDGKLQVTMGNFTAYWLTNAQAKELASALQVWIERTAEVE